MANIALYNPSAVVVNQVTTYLLSVNTPDYDSEPNKVVNPDLSALTGIPMKWWKVDTGVVVEMSSGEKDTIDNSLLPAIKITRKASLPLEAASMVVSQGYTLEVKDNLLSMYSDSLRIRPNRLLYIQPLVDWFAQVDTEVKNKQAAVDIATTINAVNAIVIDAATLIASDPHKTVSGALAATDTLDLSIYLNANALVTDPDTGIKGPFYLMQELEHRKDLYNDTENPLYKAGHTPILGAGGILVDHADRIENIETIHAKLGWHNQQITQATYTRPKDILIYYGWLNSFNSGVHGWNNEKVAQEMAKYNLIIFGDGVEDPSHGDYANTQIIIPRIKVLNPNALIFGYVSVNQLYANFQTKVDQWNTLAVHGIFMDEAGYDYGKTRAEFNTCVDYVHGKSSANKAFANAWNTDHVLGTTNDASFPNSTYNSGLVASKLTTNDYILLESFPINTTAYSGSNGYESKSDWLVRGVKAVSLRNTYGVNFVGCGIINDGNTKESNLFQFGFISALMFSLEAFGTSDTGYGSGSAKTKFITRPDVSKIGVIWNLSPSVTVDAGDADIYLRYVENAKLLVDFSSGAQTSSINKY